MNGNGPVIVAIDDYKDNLVAVKAFVTDAFPEARVITAENGRDGIALAREYNPDVILLDIVMPDMDGFEVCRLLKQDPELEYIPVIFLTALKDDRESRIRALDVGGEAFISKPFEEAEFKAQIRAMVKIHAANVRERQVKENLESLIAQRTSQLERELAERRKVETALQKKNFELQAAYEQMSATEEELRANLDEQIRQELSIRVNEERLLMAQKISKSGCWEYNLETGLIWGSAEALSIYGYPPVAGNFPIEEIEAGVEEKEQVHQAFVDFLSGKTEYNRYITVNPVDGSSQKIVHSIARLEKNEEGDPSRVVGVIQDVTELKHTEAVLRETNEAFVQAQKIARVGNWTYNVKTNCITWSDELFRVFGYEPGAFELHLENIRALFHPDDLEQHDRILAAAIATHSYEPEEYRVVYPDGSIHHLIADGVVELDANGETRILIGVCQDITERKQMEKALLEKTDELARFFTVNLDLLGIADSSGYFIRLNQAFEMTLGYSREELMAEPFLSFVHPDDQESTLSAVAALKNQTVVINFANRYRCKDGSYRWLEWCSYPYGDLIYAAARDITGKKEDEATLKAVNHDLTIEKEKAQRYFDIAGSLLFTLDPTGIITLINQKGCEILGLSRDEIIGKNWFTTFLPDYLKESVHGVFDELMKGNIEPVEYYENPVLRADGEVRILAWHNSILTDDKGHITGILSAAEDVTERNRLIAELGESNEQLIAANEELSASEEELRYQYNALAASEENLIQTKEYLENLISIANVPIIVWDSSFRITRINRSFEKLIGRTAEEVVGTSLESLFLPDESERVKRLIQTTYDGVRWETAEIGVTHLDGSRRTLLWNSATLYSPDGITPVATIAQGQDITDQRRLEYEKEKAIAQIQKNLAQLAILNDGIRNPLTVIAMSAEMMENDKVTDIILDQIMQIDLMINQVDQRWIESEKILTFLRKHYLVDILHSSDQEDLEETGSLLLGKNIPLVEEIQAELYIILDSIDALVYVADMNTYEMLFMNRPGRAIFGDFAGKKCYEYIQKDQSGPCPFCTNHLLIDKSGPTGVYQWEYLNTKTGRWYDCRDRAIRWTDGRTVHLQIATDVTEHKLVEDALRLSEGRLHTLVKTIPDLIWLKDLDGVYILCNTMFERLFGAREADIIGRTDYDFVNRRLADFFREHDRRAIEAGKASINEEWVTFADDGHEALLETIKTPMYDDKGTLIGVLGIGRDITERRRADRELLESESKFREMVETIPLAIYLSTGIEQKCEYINQKFIDLFGYTRDDIPTIEQWLPLAYPDEQYRGVVADEWSQRVQRAIDTQSPIEPMEVVVTCKDGSQKNISWGYITLKEKNYAYGLDLTERKQAEEALHTSENRYRAIYDKSPIAIELYDAAGKLVHVNSACLNLFGIEDMQAIQNFSLFNDPNIHDELKEKLRQGEIIQYQGPFDFEIVKTLHLYPTIRDGIIWLDVLITPLGNYTEPVTGFLVQTQDITKRSQAELALRESNEKHRILVEEIADPFFSLSSEGRYTFANQALAVAFGRPVEEIVGKTIWDFFPKPEAYKRFESLKEVFITGEKKIIEGPVPNANGTRHYVTTITPVKDTSGMVISAICSSKDITDRKHAEEALHEANLKLRLLTGLTRHDIFNQISAVVLLMDEALNSSDLAKIHTYATRAKEVSNQIETTIGFTREYENFGIRSSEWQRIYPIIESARSEVSIGNVTITNQIPGDLEIYADPMIRKVFTTLMENATRHGGIIANIRFYAEQDDNSLIIICEDDGTGISHNEKELIFNLGYGKNTGIGLFLAREILSITGLTIQECGIPGEGARFEILVPIGKFRGEE